jgi:hypothetical protein
MAVADVYIPPVDVNADLGYRYPGELDLRPRSELHRRIISEVTRRAFNSRAAMSRRFESWDKIDRNMVAYIAPDAAERAVKAKDPRKPVSIVIPLTWATAETLLAYWVGAFLEYPYFRYKGQGPEDEIGSVLMENEIEYQSRWGRFGPSLYVQWRDSMLYGFGAATPVWTIREGWKTQTIQPPPNPMMAMMGQSQGPIRVPVPATLYEGHRIDNINPRNFLPDVNQSISDVQKMEYCGWVTRENYPVLMARERTGEAGYFNVKFCRNIDGRVFWERRGDSGGSPDSLTWSDRPMDDATRPVDVVHFYINLIPAEWKLSGSERPEKWYFALAGGEVVIAAQPLGLNHNMYPVNICAPDFDGYSAAPMSRLEIVYGLQTVIDFFPNSHIANVRKSLNNELIYNPLFLNTADMLDNQPGKLIRIKPEAAGRPIDEMIKQLPVMDVTRGHMQDMMVFLDLWQRVTGANDTLQGVAGSRGSERRTATEVRSSDQGAFGRLAKATKMASLMSMQDYGYMLAEQTAQLLESGRFMRVAGERAQRLEEEYGMAAERGYIRYTPDMLSANYDIIVEDALAGKAEAEAWTQIMQVAGGNPYLQQELSWWRVFAHWARLNGARNTEDFRKTAAEIQLTTMPSDQLQQQSEAGNLIPMGVGATG